MKPVLITLLTCIAVILLSGREARALTEFCPARLELAPVGADTRGFQPSQVYAADLTALGPRTVTAQVAFDTDAGWYIAVLPWTKLQKQGQYKSTVFYLHFPKVVAIRRAWVHTAQSRGDGFDWSTQGIVECMPTEVSAGRAALEPIGVDFMRDAVQRCNRRASTGAGHA